MLNGIHVAFVAHESFPNRKGSGTRIAEMTLGLARAGAKVTLLTLPGTGLPPAHVDHQPLRVLEHNLLARSLAFRDAVRRKLVTLAPDVVHVRGPFEGEAAASWRAESGGKMVYEVNGLPSVELRYHYPQLKDAPSFEGKMRRLEERVWSQADAVLTQSASTARFLRLRGCKVPAVVIPNGADPAALTPEPPSALDPPSTLARHADKASARGEPLQLLYIGALQPWQGLGDLLVATRRADKQHPMALTVVGPARREWRRQIEHRGRQLKLERLTVCDAVSRAEVAVRVAEADVCVAPLTRDLRNRGQGCSPIKIFEYMAAGRCVLASDLPCVREIVDHDRTGYLARASHPHRLAEAMLLLAHEPERRRRLGEAARRTVASEATWDHRRAQLVSAYETLLASERAVAQTLAQA